MGKGHSHQVALFSPSKLSPTESRLPSLRPSLLTALRGKCAGLDVPEPGSCPLQLPGCIPQLRLTQQIPIAAGLGATEMYSSRFCRPEA